GRARHVAGSPRCRSPCAPAGQAAGRSSGETTDERRIVQCRILVEDTSLDVPENRTWVDPDGADQQVAGDLIRLERLTLATRVVQRGDQDRPGRFAPQLAGCQVTRDGDGLRRLAEQDLAHADAFLE